MARRSINHVQVSLSRGTVELPWESRQELLIESCRIEGLNSMRDAFLAVGTSRPVPLTREDKVGLVAVIDLWASDTEGGFSGLPEGIVELRDALRDDRGVAAAGGVVQEGHSRPARRSEATLSHGPDLAMG